LATYVLVVELVLLDELGDGDHVLQAVPEQVRLLAKEPLTIVTCTITHGREEESEEAGRSLKQPSGVS
jgi:hypothetical protein